MSENKAPEGIREEEAEEDEDAKEEADDEGLAVFVVFFGFMNPL